MRLGNTSPFRTRKSKKREEGKELTEARFSKRDPVVLSISENITAELNSEEAAVRLGDNSRLLHDQPSDKEMLRLFVKPGANTDIVMPGDFDRELNDVRTSRIYDVEDDHLLLDQTTPPLMPSMRGTMLEITFLDYLIRGDGSAWFRVGYKTALLDVVRMNRFGEFASDSLIKLAKPKKLSPTSTRLSNRVSPTRDMQITLRIVPYSYAVDLMDLSLGGLSFGHSKEIHFSPGTPLTFKIATGMTVLYLKGKPVHTKPAGRYKRITAVAFDDMSQEDRNTLHQLIVQMSRHLLALRAGTAAPKK